MPGSPLRRGAAATLAAVALLLAAAATAGAIALPQRTFRVSLAQDLTQSDGASQNAVLSASGRVVAMDTTATNIVPGDANGPIRDVVALDRVSGERRLVSQAAGGPAPDGGSYAPALSRNGQVVAFTSDATNLVPGDTNGATDIFVRRGRDTIVRASVAGDGGQADGPSYHPDLSGDGRYLVFTSEATNLVAADTNGRPDVFLRDLQTGATTRISVTSKGEQSDGRSSQPAISDNGRVVSFESGAGNLVPRDTNGIADVFAHDIRLAVTERVSVSSAGKQQDRSATPPFLQVSDVSRDGRYVVFDSDATNLATGDANRRTDIFLRDRLREKTTLVSVSSLNVQGNNDSFAPRLTPDGRYLAFESFASNLTPGQDGSREDIFVRDLSSATTAVATITASNQPRGPELISQVLQRPSISNDGRVVAFASSAENFVADDDNRALDVFLRRLDPPSGEIASRRGRTVRFRADDSAATTFLCRVDGGDQFLCGRRVTVRRGYRLSARAGGPGMLFDGRELRLRIGPRDRVRPRVRISPLRRGARVVRGRASDRGSGVEYVEVVVGLLTRRGCRFFDGEEFTRRPCNRPGRYVRATGTTRWRLELPRIRQRAFVLVQARAVDRAGRHSRPARRTKALR